MTTKVGSSLRSAEAVVKKSFADKLGLGFGPYLQKRYGISYIQNWQLFSSPPRCLSKRFSCL